MKKLICVLLVCGLLCACGKAPEETEPQETQYEAAQPTVPPTEPEGDEAILAHRRDVVEAEMRRIMSTLWSPAEDITYYLKNTAAGDETAQTSNEPLTLYANRIYQGLPYTHGSGSGYGFFSYATAQDEKGVYTVSGLTGDHLSGEAGSEEGSRARQGCDCADTLFWAWAQVSDSIQFSFTAQMTELYGCVKVGSYFCDLPRLSGSTKPITQANGQDVMFDSYAQLQKGDGMVLYTDTAGGHAVMVVDTHVEYSDGKINGEKSYVVIIEQTTGAQRSEDHYYNEQIGADVYICGAVDSVWSFDTIYKKGYLPVTCKELIDPSPLTSQSVTDSNSSPTINNLWTGTLTASHRIAYATVTITQDGQTLQKATAYGRQNDKYQLSLLAFIDPVEQAVLQGSIDISALPPGDYHCTVTCRLATGNTHTVHDFDFTK